MCACVRTYVRVRACIHVCVCVRVRVSCMSASSYTCTGVQALTRLPPSLTLWINHVTAPLQAESAKSTLLSVDRQRRMLHPPAPHIHPTGRKNRGFGGIIRAHGFSQGPLNP